MSLSSPLFRRPPSYLRKGAPSIRIGLVLSWCMICMLLLPLRLNSDYKCTGWKWAGLSYWTATTRGGAKSGKHSINIWVQMPFKNMRLRKWNMSQSIYGGYVIPRRNASNIRACKFGKMGHKLLNLIFCLQCIRSYLDGCNLRHQNQRYWQQACRWGRSLWWRLQPSNRAWPILGRLSPLP